MTVIVGLAENGKVYMGGDGARVSGWERMINRADKVFEANGMLWGIAGQPRIAQIIRYQLDLPKLVAQDLFCYMVVVSDIIRDTVKQRGSVYTKDALDETESDILVGVKGRMFQIDCRFAVSENANGLHAIGCGSAYALGAMRVLGGFPENRIMKALKTAGEFSIGVAPPYYVHSL